MGLSDPGYDPVLGRVDEWTDGFRTAGIIGREYRLRGQCWCYVTVQLYV